MSSSQTGRMSGPARDRALDRAERGQAAAGEDQRVGEAAGALLGLVGAVVDRDRLQEHQAVGRQQRRAALEEGVEVLPPDRLDHLDRHQPVVAAGELPVVGAERPGSAPRGRRRGSVPPRTRAAPRDGGRRHAAAVARGRVERQAAPAGPDLEQVPVGPQLEDVADPLELGSLGLLERCVRPLEQGARVHHRLAVEEELEHLVAEVVVRGDVPTSAAPRVQHGQRREPLQGAKQWGQAAANRIAAANLAGGDPNRVTRSSASQGPRRRSDRGRRCADLASFR